MQYGNRTNYVNVVVLNYILFEKVIIFSDKVSIGWKGYVADSLKDCLGHDIDVSALLEFACDQVVSSDDPGINQ